MKYSIELVRLLAVILITFTHTRHSITSEDSKLIHFIVEELPTIGTVLLSLVSGYLYFKISYHKPQLFLSKVKTLFIPFLIANLSVLLLVLVANYGFGYNALNRIGYDFSIITEGIFALNSPPINPPTYFIRDIFIIFVLIELIKSKNLYMLIIIIPLLVFGKLLLRYDILVLFLMGAVIAKFYGQIFKPQIKKIIIILLVTVSLFLIFKTGVSVYKYSIALLVFIWAISTKIKFYNVGAYSYLLHLYHSPIIVCLYPLIKRISSNEFLLVLLQVVVSFVCVYVLYIATRKIPRLRIICGYK